jgi:Protein of unknown function (DUF3455)
MKRKVFLSAVLLISTACTGPTPNPAPAVPDSLKPAATEQLLATVAARGVQIYECRAKKDDPGATQWAFVAPEADLFDTQGRLVGKHYAGPKWQSLDGSKVAGTVKASADAPLAAAHDAIRRAQWRVCENDQHSTHQHRRWRGAGCR